LAVLAAVLRPVKSDLKEYILPAFVQPDPRPAVKFHSNLDQAYGKEAVEFFNSLDWHKITIDNIFNIFL